MKVFFPGYKKKPLLELLALQLWICLNEKNEVKEETKEDTIEEWGRRILERQRIRWEKKIVFIFHP